jgi:hypothetical protein
VGGKEDLTNMSLQMIHETCDRKHLCGEQNRKLILHDDKQQKREKWVQMTFLFIVFSYNVKTIALQIIQQKLFSSQRYVIFLLHNSCVINFK